MNLWAMRTFQGQKVTIAPKEKGAKADAASRCDSVCPHVMDAQGSIPLPPQVRLDCDVMPSREKQHPALG